MLKRALAAAAITMSVLSGEAAGIPLPPPVQAMYGDAIAKEKAVRSALAPGDVPATVLKAARTVVEAYEALVRAYPTSGYSDDALWFAGELSLDAFDKFGFAQDKTTGVRLLRALATEYPASKFAKEVPQQLARVGNTTGKTEPVVKPDPAARPEVLATEIPVKAEPPAAPSQHVPTITAIRRSVLADVVRIAIEFDAETSFHEERLDDPARIFVDLSPARAIPALTDQTIRFDGDDAVVRQIRLGRHPDNTTRVVLEAAGISTFSVYPLYSPFRLVIDCVRSTPNAEPPPLPSLPLTSALKPGAGDRPVGKPPTASSLLRSRAIVVAPLAVRPPFLESASLLAEARTSVETFAEPAPATASAGTTIGGGITTPPAAAPVGSLIPAGPPIPPERNVAGGFSIARQLGLSVSRIVIDPGHGGHDPGAKGTGLTEAELVLDVALRLEKLLAKAGLDVVLTRRTDEFVPLQERTAIANREHADLFLSIHANASTTPEARGVETYFLDIAKTFTEKAVAARENAENGASGRSMADFPEFLKAIALDNKMDESRDLATILQRSLVNTLKGSNKTVRDLGVRQAPFVVLIGAAMPSVLSEISFVTNGPEARLLRSSAYRQRIAEGLFSAVRKYQTSLRSTRTAAAGQP